MASLDPDTSHAPIVGQDATTTTEPSQALCISPRTARVAEQSEMDSEQPEMDSEQAEMDPQQAEMDPEHAEIEPEKAEVQWEQPEIQPEFAIAQPDTVPYGPGYSTSGPVNVVSDNNPQQHMHHEHGDQSKGDVHQPDYKSNNRLNICQCLMM
ncbi:MAG: hypothetical protein M1828_000839 [Chrysothrix sp. TS-e1954]|nr:MAG: hypothetical protein M1828_000839 [Chrysothrix sp. TS-e1954]